MIACIARLSPGSRFSRYNPDIGVLIEGQVTQMYSHDRQDADRFGLNHRIRLVFLEVIVGPWIRCTDQEFRTNAMSNFLMEAERKPNLFSDVVDIEPRTEFDKHERFVLVSRQFYYQMSGRNTLLRTSACVLGACHSKWRGT